MKTSQKKNNVLGGLLRSILDSQKHVDISAKQLLRKIESEKIEDWAKPILLGLLISETLKKMNLSDFSGLFANVLSEKKIPQNEEKRHREGSNESFIERFKITDRDRMLISKVIEGITLKEFKEEAGISASNANKRIRALWERLGLENREQLIFVAGWMRLIETDLRCLGVKEQE